MANIIPEIQTGTFRENVRAVAVIDIGSTSIRMAIAEILASGEVRLLETVSQGVPLGKDTFTTGAIKPSTTEQCVRVLKSYRNLLNEYDIHQQDQIRVIATSSVREARNQMAFLDRLYIATGLNVIPLDEAEVTRVTYMGILPFLETIPSLSSARTVVTEVGGGSTELLLIQKGDVEFSRTYRLGSLRLRKTWESYHTSDQKRSQIMESHIKRTMDQVQRDVPRERRLEMVALGGDIRFAASQIHPGWNTDELCRLETEALRNISNEILAHSVDTLVRKYRLSYPDAETVGPALMAYAELVDVLELNHLFVSNVNLRDGLLQEMAVGGSWTGEFTEQIIRSAVDLGRKFKFDEVHARHVAGLSRKLFDELLDEHHLSPRYAMILFVAALLHEIGFYVSESSYHKHTMYLIHNSEIFGLSQNDLKLVGLVARYHRRSSPKPTHQKYSTMEKDDRIAVSQMASILRVAKSLDESHSQRVREIHCTRKNGQFDINIPGVEDLSLEQLSLEQSAWFFEEVFGLQIHLKHIRQAN